MRNRTSSGETAAPVVTTSTADLKRRRFLFSLGAGSAGAAAVAAVPAMAIAEQPKQENSDNKTSGYRETEHVRDYYRTAKI
jgi:hypothetical protein